MAKFYKILSAIIITLTMLNMINSTSNSEQPTSENYDYKRRMISTYFTVTGGADPVICILHQPCGWEGYKRFVRTTEYFVRNSCICPTNTKCINLYDDLPNDRFVHMCMGRQWCDFHENRYKNTELSALSSSSATNSTVSENESFISI